MLIRDLLQDLGFSLRALRRSPGFAAVAVLTLALAIGAASAMFSVLNGVLFQDLPVQEQDEVMVLWTEAPTRASDRLPVPYRDLVDYGEVSRAFEAIAGVAYYGAAEMALIDKEVSLSTTGTLVTGDLFPLLGVAPEIGRTLRPSDDLPGADPVMVIGHGLWQRYFGGDESVVGHRLDWNGTTFSVVGVMPRGFEYPAGAQVWVPVLPVYPATVEAEAEASEVMLFDLVGRLRQGASIDDARQDYGAFLRTGNSARSPAFRGMRPVVTPLHELIVGDAQHSLWLAAGAVALLLLIACVNVANLLLIRGLSRARELAIRSALGAGRWRQMRHLLAETGLLAFLGGILGVLVAHAAVRMLLAVAPANIVRREMVEVDWRVLIFALATTMAAALISGLLPALLAARNDVGTWLRGGRGTASPREGQVLRHVLVVGQIALAILVVVGAGLLVRSLVALQNAEMGFNEERLLVFQTTIPPDVLPEREQRLALQQEMLSRVSAIPGVASAAAIPTKPFSGQGGWTAMYSGEGQSVETQAANSWVNFEVVGPNYFTTLEIPILRGRLFLASDRGDAPRVAVVSEAVARHTWPGEEALGKRVKLGPLGGPGEWHTVVGIVGETRYRDLKHPQPSLYLPVEQFGGPVPLGLALRVEMENASVIPQIRYTLRQMHPELALLGGGSMRDLMAEPLARPRFMTLLLGTFGGLTLFLAIVGIYGALAATVRQRTRELGIRLALGATAAGVRRIVLAQGLKLAFIGCAAGLLAALTASRLLTSMLFRIHPADPLTYATVAILLLGAATLACLVPAMRASRIDPALTLESD